MSVIGNDALKYSALCPRFCWNNSSKNIFAVNILASVTLGRKWASLSLAGLYHLICSLTFHKSLHAGSWLVRYCRTTLDQFSSWRPLLGAWRAYKLSGLILLCHKRGRREWLQFRLRTNFGFCPFPFVRPQPSHGMVSRKCFPHYQTLFEMLRLVDSYRKI